jgi:hypothetical protein
MAGISLPLASQRSFGQTSRQDRWWLQPTLVFVGLSAFVVYATWAAFQGKNFEYGPYLSPFYSPVIFGDSPHAWFGKFPSWWPSWLPASPALLILWGPVGFRLTCYYYRGAYYKAFWADPPNCAVGEPRKGYIGESSWPLKVMNIHRFFFYVATLFIFVLAYDALMALWFQNDLGQTTFGIGVGTVILWANVILLSGYTFGCHSLRHLIGGRMDCMSKAPVCQSLYNCVSALNNRHMLWAWTSLVVVGFADVYIRLCAAGVWKDYHVTF